MNVFVCIIFLFYIPEPVLSSKHVTLRPTFNLEGSTFLKGQLGKPLTVSCNVEQTSNEYKPKSGMISINGIFYPTSVFRKIRYEHRIRNVTESLHNATVGCTIIYDSGYNNSVFQTLFVTGVHHKPILRVPEALYLDECERITCEVKETIRPKPVLTFNVSVYQIESVLQPCINSTVCRSFALPQRLERKWYRSQILCCVSSEFFKQLCSEREKIFLQFPPQSVNITYEIVKEFATYAIAKITCFVIAANPSCNISWVHSANATEKSPLVTLYKEDGIYTSEYKLLNISNDSQEIRCQSKCSLFNGTLEEKLNVVSHSCLKDENYATDNKSKYKSFKGEFVAALVTALFSILCNIILGYIVLGHLRNHRIHR